MKYMEREEIHKYCMSKPCAYETAPFGANPICYKVAGKIFAQLNNDESFFKMTLKTNPEAADFYRQAFPKVIVRGYHCPPVQQPYWNTIDLYALSDKALLFQMIDEAYSEVIQGLTKKEQRKIPILSEFEFVKTDGTNEEFVYLCEKLDENLEEIVAGKIQRQKYVKYNQLDSIHDVILVRKNGVAIGCGAYKFYDKETAEIKRVFLDKSYRKCGVGKELLRRLEADAKISGFRYAILETGELLAEATGLYNKMGYKVIPNYGQYVDMPESLCMSKKL